MFHMW